MRRLIAGAVLAGVVLAGAACGSDNPTTPGTTTPVPTTPSVDVSANTQQVCSEVEKGLTDSVAAFTRDAPAKIAQAVNGGAAAQTAAVDFVKSAFTQWATLMRTEAAKAADPGLKSALEETATQFDSAAANIRTFDDIKNIQSLMNNAALNQAGSKIQQFCGGG